jgi:HK97 gp10 family phage protein
MAKNEFTITGIKEIQRAFRELPDDLLGQLVRQAIRKGLKPVLAAVKAGAPRKSGALARAIKIRALAKRKRGVIALEIRVGDGDFKGTTFYGGFQELGTSKMKGRHFMAEAFDGTKEEAAATIMDLVAKGIEREAKA